MPFYSDEGGYKSVKTKMNQLKVPMKLNLFLFSIEIYLVKYAFPKFETSGI